MPNLGVFINHQFVAVGMMTPRATWPSGSLCFASIKAPSISLRLDGFKNGWLMEAKYSATPWLPNKESATKTVSRGHLERPPPHDAFGIKIAGARASLADAAAAALVQVHIEDIAICVVTQQI